MPSQPALIHVPPPSSLASRPDLRWSVATTVLMLSGAGLVEWSSAVHLHLWQSGYRAIPSIGVLFLLQAVSGFVLGGMIALSRRLLPALLGVGFMMSTVAGLLISSAYRLFGFKNSIDAPFATESIVIEAVGAATLALAAVVRIKAARLSISD